MKFSIGGARGEEMGTHGAGPEGVGDNAVIETWS